MYRLRRFFSPIGIEMRTDAISRILIVTLIREQATGAYLEGGEPALRLPPLNAANTMYYRERKFTLSYTKSFRFWGTSPYPLTSPLT